MSEVFHYLVSNIADNQIGIWNYFTLRLHEISGIVSCDYIRIFIQRFIETSYIILPNDFNSMNGAKCIYA